MTSDQAPGEKEKAYWPLFRREVTLFWGEGVTTEYARRCAGQLLGAGPEVIRELLLAGIRSFRDAEECHGEPIPFLFEFEGLPRPQNLDEPESILPYLLPVELSIDGELPGSYSVSAFLECAWEPEEGLQWIVRDGRPFYGGLSSHRPEELYTAAWRDLNYLYPSK